MNAFRAAISLLLFATAWTLAPLAVAAGFADVLDTPAQRTPLASKSLLNGIARAGTRLVAVGQRGHIVVSTDGGANWKQSAVPVSSDLTAVYFVDEKRGWAVGHDGVVLHTDDGGDALAPAARWSQGERAHQDRDAAQGGGRAGLRRSEAAAGRSVAPCRAGARQAVSRCLVRRCEPGLRRRRVQPHPSHGRRRPELDAVVRPHRQPQVFQSLRHPSCRRRAFHCGRRRTHVEARHCCAAFQGPRASRTPGASSA